MATIEPRLMHLLNDSNDTHTPPGGLPSFHDLQVNSALPKNLENLSLPPLEFDVCQRSDKLYPQGQIPTKHFSRSLDHDSPSRLGSSREDGDFEPLKLKRSGHNLGMLLGHPETNDSTGSLQLFLEDPKDTSDDAATKKRQRALTGKDDLSMQLPHPLKRQKSSLQVNLPNPQVKLAPIINPREAPPNAVVFPPIASIDFDDSDPDLNLSGPDNRYAASDHGGPSASADADKNAAGKGKRRATKPRRKWSEEETNHLLLGVSKHGVGKWTSILEDPHYKFNDRTAGDLKDRFRTCCPVELRGKKDDKDANGSSDFDSEPPLRTKTSLLLENILVDTDDYDRGRTGAQGQQETEITPKQKKSRAHRKKMEDLKELGINGPFKKSHRRVRKPFTDQDDRDILDGLEKYGPAWTKIQRDARFGLAGRQPTDLRDRVRNKYPDVYSRIEKGGFQVKEPARSSGPIEPSITITADTALKLASAQQSKATDSVQPADEKRLPAGILERGNSSASRGAASREQSSVASLGNAGEMDISRLLLDDSCALPGR